MSEDKSDALIALESLLRTIGETKTRLSELAGLAGRQSANVWGKRGRAIPSYVPGFVELLCELKGRRDLIDSPDMHTLRAGCEGNKGRAAGGKSSADGNFGKSSKRSKVKGGDGTAPTEPDGVAE